MAKAVAEVALGAAAIAAPLVLPGLGIAVSAAIASSLYGVGASFVLSGIADALPKNGAGIAEGVTTPIGPWGYVYGTQMVGGILTFCDTNNSQGVSNDKQLHRVYTLAAHPCLLGNWQLRVGGKQVPLTADGAGWSSYSPTQSQSSITSISRSNGVVTMVLAQPITGQDGEPLQVWNVADNTFNGTWNVTQPNPDDATTFTYICGGPDTTTSGGEAQTTYPDFQNKIYVELLDGNHTSTFEGLLSSGTTWGANDLCLGRTLAYVRMGYDASVFPSIPNVSFVIQGKSNIFDPRTNTYGWTNNAALCIADYLCIPTIQGGFGMQIGTDIPTAQLIAAANLADEQVDLAGGGTVSRYTCDTFFNLNTPRGGILKNLLSSCAGRISYQGGQYSIFPGAWVSPTLQLSDADLTGPIDLAPRLSIRDTCNAVKGTYISPENAYQQADVPMYCQDSMHGYVSDPWLAEDSNERIIREANFPCTDNSATAQRLEKIALLRTRFQQRLNLTCSMRAYQAIALDVIQFSHPRYDWVNENFEVLSSGLAFTQAQSGMGLIPKVQLSLAQTDPSIYDWEITEQLTPQGYQQPNNIGVSICDPPENVTLYSGPGTTVNGITYPSTVTTGADGRVQSSLYASWTAVNDANIVNGGHIEVQWRQGGSTGWTALANLTPLTSSVFINGVTDSAQYYVQIRNVNCANVPSDWVLAGPETINDSLSTFAYSGIEVAPQALSAEAYSDGTDTIFVAPFTATVGSMTASCLGSVVSLTGLLPNTEYEVYYVDPYFQGGAITPIATTNPSDFLNKAGYFLIGTIMSPQWSTSPNQAGYVIYAPGEYLDIGPRSTATPGTVCNKLAFTTDTAAVISERFIGGSSPQSIFGCCQFSGFPAGIVANGTTSNLNVCVSFTETTPGQMWAINLGYVSTSGVWTTVPIAYGDSATSATLYTGDTISIGANTTFTYAIPEGVLIDSVVVTCTVQTPVGSASSVLTASGAINIASMNVYYVVIA